ncbi:hypothetical protein NQ314_003705 [Rhamnusium bicolor]|uniref:Integrase catalytic domain-containing protein n=1 Tax=Rhamnusium bicolor TaxID=1586634 RepID=A0AAV8ZN16_9CUCU|nr:hypothetical protein NQ314_003705 [Rhamnusium bicolor]
MQQVTHCLGFNQVLTPSYHPEANPVEKKNRDLKTQLAISSAKDHTSWRESLPAIRFAINTSYCQSTSYSPVSLTFKRELRTPDDVHRYMRSITEQDNSVPQITPYLLSLGTVLKEARENHEQSQDSA